MVLKEENIRKNFSNVLFKKIRLFSCLFVLLTIYSCGDQIINKTDDPIIQGDVNLEIKDFIWKALNDIYLWKDQVPSLGDSRRSDVVSYSNLLKSYTSPSDFFNALLYEKGLVDRFSLLSDNYVDLENSLLGRSKSSGMNFGLTRLDSPDNIFGFVTYVLKASDAEKKGVKRGMLFGTVNGVRLTIGNYKDLLFSNAESMSIGIFQLNGNVVKSTGNTITLIKTEIDVNPIYKEKTFDVNGVKVGYLMFNGFYNKSNIPLNDVFGRFKNENVTELVLDLRYNRGGTVTTAEYLASMITGSHAGEVLYNTIWNSKYQNYFKEKNPENLVGRFPSKIRISKEEDTPINSINMKRMYVLVSSGTASASELVITGLIPYIDVKTIGTNTVGKFHASTTLYDSPSFSSKKGINSKHKYALQPLIFKYSNSTGFTDFYKGLIPTIGLKEDLKNMGILGDENEPLLSRALKEIRGISSGEIHSDTDSPIFIDNILEVKGMLNVEYRDIFKP